MFFRCFFPQKLTNQCFFRSRFFQKLTFRCFFRFRLFQKLTFQLFFDFSTSENMTIFSTLFCKTPNNRPFDVGYSMYRPGLGWSPLKEGIRGGGFGQVGGGMPRETSRQ